MSQDKKGREYNKFWQGIYIYLKIPRITLIQQRNMKWKIEVAWMFICKEEKRHEKFRLSNGFVYHVAPYLKDLKHPSNENLNAIIWQCLLLYLDGCICNKYLLLDYHWCLENAGGHSNKFTPKQNRYRWKYKKDWPIYGTK